jgi:hypothetical protein
MYEPRWGRFVSPDELAERFPPNRYAYVLNRPTSMVDPTGNSAEFNIDQGADAGSGSREVQTGPPTLQQLASTAFADLRLAQQRLAVAIERVEFFEGQLMRDAALVYAEQGKTIGGRGAGTLGGLQGGATAVSGLLTSWQREQESAEEDVQAKQKAYDEIVYGSGGDGESEEGGDSSDANDLGAPDASDSDRGGTKRRGRRGPRTGVGGGGSGVHDTNRLGPRTVPKIPQVGVGGFTFFNFVSPGL